MMLQTRRRGGSSRPAFDLLCGRKKRVMGFCLWRTSDDPESIGFENVSESTA